MPASNAGQQTPTWNAGSIQSINVDSDNIQNGDQLFYDENKKLWVTGNIPSFVAGTGSADSPSYSFEGSTGTGMYLAGPDSLGFAAGTEPVAEISPTGFNVSVQIQAATGVVGAPEYSFTSDTDTGIYLAAMGLLGFSTGGEDVLSVSPTGFNVAPQILAATGVVGAPEYSFTSDTDTGIYHIGADNIGFTTNGTLRMDIDSTDITSTLPHVYPYATAAGNAGTVNIPNGTQIFNLTVGGGSATDLIPPGGVAGQILYVRNDSGFSTTTLVVQTGRGATFAYDGSNWLNVSDST
jgi:hypothetical protein